jgi:1-acyl-sn-glycerol-3-phosphate acyltransferase
MKTLRTWCRFFLVIGLIMAFVIHQLIVLISSKEKRSKLEKSLRNVRVYASLILKVLNVTVKSGASLSTRPAGLIVCNHQSYIDVLVLVLQYPSFFITSVEIKETPGLGLVTKMAGCFFVERRKARLTPKIRARELAEMQSLLDQGLSIFLFPEGTSSDGTTILPFKTSFFQLATLGRVNVTPVSICYHDEASIVVPWYGSMGFLSHLIRVCALGEIVVSLREHSALNGNDHIDLSLRARSSIEAGYAEQKVAGTFWL